MKIKRINHIGVVVRDADDAAQKLGRVLGVEAGHTEAVPAQQIESRSLMLGDCAIEVIESKGNPGVDRFLQKRGPGMHHIAVEVEGIEDVLGMLTSLGVELIDRAPRPGVGGSKVAFVHPKATGGLLIELVEPTR